MIRIICDRCGSCIETQKPGYISYNFRDGLNGSLTQDNEFENCHYCGSCMDEIRMFVRKKREELSVAEDGSQNAEAAEATEGTDRASKRTKRKSVDVGKIIALRNAGWSNRKIADEMGMQPQAVANAVCQYKKKHMGGAE